MPERASRNSKPRWRRVALLALAVAFAAATILYTTLWLLANRWAPDVELGFDNTQDSVVTRVLKDSPAEKAGLRPGDRVLAIDGARLQGTRSLFAIYKLHKPGDAVQLSVARPGETSPFAITAVFRERVAPREQKGLAGAVSELLRNSYPVPFVIVGLVVLFLRVEDRRIWHLALLFASFIPGPGGLEFGFVPARLQTFALVYQVLAQGMLGPLFYWFFALFPVRSPLDRRAPWLRWVSLASLPAGILALAMPELRVSGLPVTPALPGLFGTQSQMQVIFICSILGSVSLGVVSLASNFFHTRDPEARRKIRVIFWGTAVAFAPLLAVATSHFFVEYQDPDWLDAAVIIMVFLFPVSFAYAVVKHRVLEIPVLLRRSARYLFVQRGFTVLLALVSIGVTLLFASAFTRYLRPMMEAALPAGIALGALFGTAVLWGGAQLHRRVSARIDRAFFRGAYDARLILEDLAEKTRMATDSGQLAGLLERHLREALQPSSLAIYFSSGDSLTAASDGVPGEIRSISAQSSMLADLAERAQPWDFPTVAENGAENFGLALLHPECLVPVMGRGRRLAGLFVLGPRLSEEPYSGEDKRLLASVAGQAGTALENIRLAGEIADRIDAERRVAREMEIAREVQSRLLPQEAPRLKTLEIAAECIEARAVGGDYFDFLGLGEERVGLVLADVSGKGVHAALLMANLQAYLRSQSAIAPLDPARLLQQVNRMFWKATDAQHFATLFFGVYDDRSREMVYVNCGHNAPILLRTDGGVQRLSATATVVGVFEEWECEVEKACLAPGDLLAIFSDGVTEAARGEEEYGEARLIERLQACRQLPANEIVRSVFASVQEFGAGVQSDDLTLVIAKARA